MASSANMIRCSRHSGQGSSPKMNCAAKAAASSAASGVECEDVEGDSAL